MTLHFRGPLELKSVAVYTPSKGKRDVPQPHSKRHGHQHLHKKHHEHEAEKRADMVTAVIDGVTVSWENNWFGGASTPAPAATAAAVSAASVKGSPAESASKSKTSSSKSKSSSSASVPAGDYERVAYYSAKEQVADGLVFLGNLGDPALSGTWDT